MIIFLSTSILRPVLTTLISKLAGNEQGFAMGMNNAYMSIGNVLGPLLAGLLFDVHILYPFILRTNRSCYYNNCLDEVERSTRTSLM